MPADKSIMIALGKPGADPIDDEDETVESSDEELAVEDLFSAMKSKDAAAGAEALKAFLAACGAYTPSDEDDGE